MRWSALVQYPNSKFAKQEFVERRKSTGANARRNDLPNAPLGGCERA